jgi:hypothetical protein
MRQLIFAVRDIQVGSFNRPFYAPSKGAAIRSFNDEVNRDSADNVMFHHSQDFELYFLGEFDDESGQFVDLVFPPSLLMRAFDSKA